MNAISVLRDMPASERRKLGEAGHRYYMEQLSFDKGVDRFEQVMKSLVNKDEGSDV